MPSAGDVRHARGEFVFIERWAESAGEHGRDYVDGRVRVEERRRVGVHSVYWIVYITANVDFRGCTFSRRRRDVLAFTVEIVSKMGWVYSRCAPRDVDFTSDVVNFSVIHRVDTR